jgi:hypothetical protein
MYSRVELKGLVELEEADVGGDPGRVVILVHLDTADLALLHEIRMIKQVFFC